MSDRVLSPGVELLWKIACGVALRNQNLSIEPKHLLYVICEMEKSATWQSKPPADRPEDEVQLKNEIERFTGLAHRHGVDLAGIRRAIRKSLPSDAVINLPMGWSRAAVSRSSATQRIFDRALEISRQIGATEADLLCLLRALVEAHDAQVEELAGFAQDGLRAILQELEQSDAKALLNISLDPLLSDLDQVEKTEPGVVKIGETVDASLTIQPQGLPSAAERLSYLSEVTWEFGTHGLLDSMLRKVVEQLLRIVTAAERCAILLRGADTKELLLKAHGPANTTPRISLTSATRAMVEKKGFVWTRGQDLTFSQKELKIECGMYAPMVVNGEAIGVICFDSASQLKQFSSEDLLLVTSFAHQVALAIANHELRRTLKQNAEVLERLLTNFSPKVRTRLLQWAQVGRLQLGGQHSVVSILCCDIRGFARLSSKMETQDVLALLNEYFAALTECIFRHDGTIDKFVGDAILAVFGSPEADPQHCHKAVMAGLEMQHVMEQVTQRRSDRKEVTCEIGVGIHTGDVLHGFIGSPERMEYTVIGDTVNRAARYCEGAKGKEVLISPEVHERVWNITYAQQVSIPTKHEGDLQAYRVARMRGVSE